MFFNKYPHPANFVPIPIAFPPVSSSEVRAEVGIELDQQPGSAELAWFADDVACLTVRHARFGPNRSLVPLEPPAPGPAGRIQPTNDGFQVLGRDGQPILSLAAQGFGACGEASMFQFAVPSEVTFYGLGEKTYGEIELSGYRNRFWNTDVWSDFHFAQWGGYPTDPPYFSTPYVLVRSAQGYVGLLLHNPYPAFIETPGIEEARVFVEWQRTHEHLLMGNDGGEPCLYIIAGDTIADVTRKLQRLVGVTPRPPIWALGYHQSRWGYAGHDDLTELDRQFATHQIPCSALWMDLDYMDGYRIFTVADSAFPGGPQRTADALAANGRRIVPIIDPGVKLDPGYQVYDDGTAHGHFCLTQEGRAFVGLVWPGETVFPDFARSETRAWWAGYARDFRASGFGACWVDMNDPSTGPVDPTEMRFEGATLPHAAHRNQYALGMQIATQDGFLQAEPNERPFILSRSGYTGSSRYAAIWTGDNVSNEFYLRLSVPTSLGMSLSGLPFNGPDLGGFGGDVTDALMVEWMKAGFLFPFLRNHCGRGHRDQEPFNFPPAVMQLLRRYIRLRMKLMPYLYQQFVRQSICGDPIMRPMLYAEDSARTERIADQFLIGPSILQAPFLDLGSPSREVYLPSDGPWYDTNTGRWLSPGTHRVSRQRDGSPIYVAPFAVIPMQAGTPTDNAVDLLNPVFHVFLPSSDACETASIRERYLADDGLSFDYQRGVESEIELEMSIADGNIAIAVNTLSDAFGEIRPTFVFHGRPDAVHLNGQLVQLERTRTAWAGAWLDVTRIVAG
ncbi:MAG: glycoside hydrolase family 31 protein [Fimbriimonadaceae bacterium]|nr:glycoside hydrolase family 31 protein [Fimbriimonadaceae bacterium]